MGKDSIHIAVRVRPFAPNESGQDWIVAMRDNNVQLKNPSSGEWDCFAYTHAFWSHDNKNGRVIFTNSDLFDKVGTQMLQNSYDGFNSTVFAYGQTGSGKSYSIEGSPDDKGLLQRVCEALFIKKTELETANEGEIIINCSYLEIYNENLKDLLDPKEKQLKIFGTKKGIVVKNLSKVYWENFNEILKLLEDGKKMRVVGATWMNKQSSRSHAIFTLYITYKEGGSNDTKKQVKNSEIHIVDLAGSERQSKTKATGDRLKEGANINKSLSYLGIVIEKLSTGKDAKHIPYRNSQLTYFLSESLGGNSKTIMIAAISPAASNHEETLSTLKFADRAANIKTTTKANIAEEENLKAILAQEIMRLRDEILEIEMGKTTIADFSKGLEEAEKMRLARRKAKDEKRATLEVEIQRLKEMLQVAENNFKDQAKKEKANLESGRNALFEQVGLSTSKLKEALNADEDSPYLVNVSDDPTLAGCLIFFLKDGETSLGSSDEHDVDILIRGLGMRDIHWHLQNNSHESVKIKVEGDSRVLVNGWLVQSDKTLKHGDRLVFGHGNAWKIMIPTQAQTGDQDKNDNLEYANIMYDRLNSDGDEPKNIRRYLHGLEDRLGKDAIKRFIDMFARALDLIEEANEYSAYRYKMFQKPRNNVYFTLVVSEDIKNFTSYDPFLAVKMRSKDFDKTIFLWDFEKFRDRVELMMDWYDDINTNGMRTRESYLDPWNDITDEEVPFYLEDEHEEQENQKARLQIYIQQWENKKRYISKQNKKIAKKLENFGIKKKTDVKFLSENIILGTEPKNEEEKELYTTLEANEQEIEPVIKTWYDNELEVIENKQNIKDAKKKIKRIDKGEKLDPGFMGKWSFSSTGRSILDKDFSDKRQIDKNIKELKLQKKKYKKELRELKEVLGGHKNESKWWVIF